ncbi:phosphotransferase family protein [Evansella halocellulosilytica]|uniref:phosphotransferase family protein n=1 Tax=Evansella halocellulosilytica TaxID=2011013 RepID=UPI00211CA76A|nr:phosphotransferase family protein [Evansella halocellulosilytica]
MKHLMGGEWKLHPAGGATGEAYVAQQGDEKIFIKRNSSPFLAVLSAEGIVPKLLWTKRLENGDVITAQRWVNGRELNSSEMNAGRVANLLSRIHRSGELRDMYMRMGNHPLTPRDLYYELKGRSARIGIKDPYIQHAMDWLDSKISCIQTSQYVVCHADVNHNNWMVSQEGGLYLIDWDGAIVADPALDLAPLLYLYVPKSDWDSWLSHYGEPYTKELEKRLQWYMIAQCVEGMIWRFERQEYHEITKWSDILTEILKEAEYHSL